MKTKIKLILALCGAVSTTAAFGATIVWSGAADGTNLVNVTNWVGNVRPNNANADVAQWDGTTTSNLVLHYNTSDFAGFAGQSGIGIYLTAAQTHSVQFLGDLASPGYMAIGDISIDADAGAFVLGNTNPATRFDVICRPSGAVKIFMNNSTNPAIINPYVRWAGGSGAVWTHDYQGTGNWYVTNYLVNDNGPGMNIQVDGPGTMYWSPSVPTTYQANGIQSPVVINSGTMVLQSPHPKLGSQAFTLGGTFIFDAPSKAQTLTGIFSGGGTNIVNNGTLTLSGQSTYTGDTVLQGGELVVNGTENAGTSGPLGLGTIDFNGAILGFSLNNTFDYSPRFSTVAGQQYKFDTAGFNVTLTNELSSSGGTLTKLGAGNLSLAGTNSYSGLATVSGGKLIFQGVKTGAGSITLADGAALDIYATGTPMTPASLTVGSSAGAYLEFDSVNSTTIAPIAAGSVTTPGLITVNINSGTFTVGSSYPLFSWSSGSAPAVSLGILNGYIGTLTTNGSTITLNIQATAFKWTGNNNNSWDLTTANNWQQNGGAVVFANGAPALLDDTASGNQNITITGLLLPTLVSFNTSTANYVVNSSAGNDIGSGDLLKAGNGMVTLAGGANTYTGKTTISGGTLSVGTLANGGSPSDIGAAGSGATNLVLNGGTLQYTGTGASIDRAFSVTPAGGVIDGSGSDALTITAPAVGLPTPGPRTLTLTGTGSSNTLATVIANNVGATALIKNGTGTWILSSNNTYSGLTTINNGVLQIGADGASGTLGTGNILNNGRLDFHRTGTVTVGGNITGTGAVTNDGTGTVILTGANTYSGGTYINAGIVQIGTGGASGKLNANGSIVMTNNSTFIFNSTSALGLSGYLVGVQGQGNLIVRANCTFSSIDQNDYTGWTLIESGASFQPCVGNEGRLFSSVITNNGTLLFMRQDQYVFGYSNNIVGTGKVVTDISNFGDGWATLAGTNTYTGGTWIKGGGIILGDGLTPDAGSILGPVIFTNTSTPYHVARTLVFNRPDNITFTNSVITAVTDGTAVNDQGRLAQMGTGVVILTGSVSYPGLTAVGPGTLQFGNGGTSGSPSTLAAITNNGTVVFNRSDSITVSGAITDGTLSGSGQGSLVQLGSGTVTLSASNSYTGATIVSNGTLVVSGGYIGGDLNLEGGKIASAASGTVKILNIGGNMNINSGTVLATLNKSVAVMDTNLSVTVSNTYYSVSNLVNLTGGTITAAGGTLKLINAGPTLSVGDKFTLFSGPVTGGALMTIASPGFTVANGLATDGSVTVTAVSPAPTITASLSGANLNLAWPASWTGGVHLQSQTNTVAKGLGTNWVTIPGTDGGNTYSAPVIKANGSVFYRLITP